MLGLPTHLVQELDVETLVWLVRLDPEGVATGSTRDLSVPSMNKRMDM